METDSITLDQLRKRLGDYVQESQRLKQTFCTAKLPTTPVLNESLLQQIEMINPGKGKINLQPETNKLQTLSTIELLKKRRARRKISAALIASILIGLLFVLFLVDPILQLLCLSRIITRYKGFNDSTPFIYFVRSAHLLKAASFILQKLRFVIGEWEIPS